jgi:hypothetical protein
MKKIFLLLSLLVSPRVFLEGGQNPPPFSPVSDDILIGTIHVYANGADDYETFYVTVESFYSLNIPPQGVVLMVADTYKELVCNYCRTAAEDGMQIISPADLNQTNNGKRKI